MAGNAKHKRRVKNRKAARIAKSEGKKTPTFPVGARHAYMTPFGGIGLLAAAMRGMINEPRR